MVYILDAGFNGQAHPSLRDCFFRLAAAIPAAPATAPRPPAIYAALLRLTCEAALTPAVFAAVPTDFAFAQTLYVVGLAESRLWNFKPASL